MPRTDEQREPTRAQRSAPPTAAPVTAVVNPRPGALLRSLRRRFSSSTPDKPPAEPPSSPGLILRVIRDRRIAFLLVGGLNTVIGALWFLLFDHLIGARWNGHGHYPALVLTYVAAILCAFVLYRRLVFRVRGQVMRDLARFSSVYVSAFLVNIVLLGLMVDGLGWRPFPSQCLITFVTTVFSWVGHNRFSFKRSPASPTQDDSTAHVASALTRADPDREAG